MHSIRTRFTLIAVCAIVVALSIATLLGVLSIKKLGESDADQMLHLMCTTGAMNLESYFTDVERSVETVATLVQDSFNVMPYEQLDSEVERARNLFGRVASNTNGVLTYYFRIDPQFSESVKGFWYVNQDGSGFKEHEVTDISQYNTDDTSSLVWFTVPKATGEGIWLPPYFTENLNARVISYNMPIYWNDQYIGVIGIEIEYETLKHEVENIRLFENGYAFILDEDSNVIYHPMMDSDLTYGEKLTVFDYQYLLEGENHIHYNYKGVDKEAVWNALSNGMKLYVTVPIAEINSGWKNLIIIITIASLVVLVIVSCFIMRYLNHITKPLRELTEAAKQVDSGNYDVSLEYNKNDEVGMLTRTFKQLVAHTKEHISFLNKQVYFDALTSVRNKGAYEIYIQKIQDKMDDPSIEPEFAIGVFDCDNLKHINDTYGHDKGDIYIKTASSLICKIYSRSPVFRIGGDEFAVILEDDDYLNREALLQQFRKARAEICEKAENDWNQVNVTMGLAVYDPENDTAVIDVARRADQCMYENKRIRKENNFSCTNPDSTTLKFSKTAK